ncbi:MAG TPA: TetR family transcriptional regulator [Terriglobales bacterium]|nr:TetR family transcriptional regulator [Terriglobales bacterium]
MRNRSALAGDAEARSTRDTILDVAERHFAERGFAGASVRDIAADSGLKNQASLYHYFEHKRALYEAVLSRGLEPIIATVIASSRVERPAGADPADALAPYLDPVIDHLVERPHLPRLIQRAALDDSRYLRSTLGRLLKPLYTEGLTAVSQAASGWPVAERFHVAVALYQLIFGYFANATMFEIVADYDPLSLEAIERQRRFLHAAVAQLLGYVPPEKR